MPTSVASMSRSSMRDEESESESELVMAEADGEEFTASDPGIFHQALFRLLQHPVAFHVLRFAASL